MVWDFHVRVLVTGASKHGSTLDIIDVIARTLVQRGFEVVDKQVDEVGTLDSYEAAVIGSGVYVGHWLSEALTFVARHVEELSRIPVWLFSSGPLGDPPLPADEPTNISELTAKLAPRGHMIFAGRLDTDRLGLGEKLIVTAVHAPKGDFRDFAAVRAWADEIADELRKLGSAASGAETLDDSAAGARRALLRPARH